MNSNNINDSINKLDEEKAAEYFNIVIDELNIAIFDWNFEKGETIVNEGGSRYLLCRESLDDIVNNSASLDTVHPDDLPLLGEFFSKTESGVKRAEITLRLKTVDNDYKWCRIISIFDYNDSGMPKRTFGIIVDVDKEKTEVFEKDSFINAIPTGIGIFEVNGNVTKQVYMNEGFYRLLDDEREARLERTNNNFLNGIYKDDRSKVKQCMKTVIDGDDTVSITCRAIKGNGDVRWIRLTASVGTRMGSHIMVYCSYVSMEDEIESQKALEQGRAILEVAIKSANMCVWEYDCINHTVTQTENAIAKHGYEKIIHSVPQSLIDNGYIMPQSQKAFLKMYSDLYETQKTVQGDFYVLSEGETDCWWEHIILTPVFDNTGKMVKAYGTSLDVTERKEKEESYYRQIGVMSESDDKNLILKSQYNLTQSHIVYCSSMRDDTMNISLDEDYNSVMNRLISVIASDSDTVKKAKQIFDRKSLLKAYESGKTDGYYEYKRKFGNNAVMYARINYLMSADPKTGDIILFAYFYDNTEHMLESKILERLSAQEYNAIGIIDISTGDYIFKNMNMVLPLNVPLRGHNYHKRCEEIVEHSEMNVNKNKVLKSLEMDNIIHNLSCNDVFSIQYSVKRKADNSMHYMRLGFRYIDESKTSILYTFSDITEIYKQQQKQLLKTQKALETAEKATRAKTDFLSRMSHDIRTPLNAILGTASLAQDELDNPQAIKEYINTINSSGKFLLGLINDILDINKIESGKIELRPEICLVSDFKSSIENAIRPLIESKNIDFVFNMNCGYTAVVVDKLRHHQIFFNLLSNAAKYTPKGGRVEFITQQIEAPDGIAGVRNIVRDNGIGMTKEYMSHLFEPFTRDENAEINQIEGSGLGLAIVKNIVDAMGGSISVKSQLGKGTEFVVDLYLPIGAVSDVDNKQAAMYDQSRLKGANILLVDDNRININIAKKLLEKKVASLPLQLMARRLLISLKVLMTISLVQYLWTYVCLL